MADYHIKRIYDPAAADDGYRILVDRLWPRGVSKPEAQLDLWLKEVAPSPELRQWFGHDPARFAEFSARYREELAANPAVAELRQLAEKQSRITLLYGARDPQVNHAAVLRDFLLGQ
ncbi:MAG TPA: DUF488 domain-containing protein [Candidatus Saccharimonadales bacterium]|nr:DUF488 domain-containing protein [Candidatus Saccharimonadales bacterium]